MKRLLLASTIAFPLSVATSTGANALLPVIDEFASSEWVQQIVYMGQQLQEMQQQVQQAIQTVHSLTNIPQNMIGQVEGLLQGALQNPLQNISFNLNGLMSGSGVGSCISAGSGFLNSTQAWSATGTDFAGSLINGSASRLAGLMTCTHQMMQSTEQRLQQMPQLLNELQGCGDVTCATAISGRIQLETATINVQQQQAVLIGLAQQQQRWAQEDLIYQKQRADSEAVANAAPALSASGQAGSSSGNGGVTMAILP